MKPRIRLGFSDFYPAFDFCDNYFTRLLSKKYEVVVSDQPDFLIYSDYGEGFRRHSGIRIYFTGENIRPKFTDCDYAFNCDFSDHPNHMRLPCWRFHAAAAYSLPIRPRNEPEKLLATKTRFCNFVFSNKYCPTRNRFFRLLSKYKRVDAGGRLYNNIGGTIGAGFQAKLKFIQPYKFTIAFENETYPGYTTEKLYDALYVDSLPIYWGNPKVGMEFNRACFLDCRDYGSLNALVQRVIELDQDDRLYYEYFQEERFQPDVPSEADFSRQVLAQFDRIISTGKTPVAQQRKPARHFIIDPAQSVAALVKRKTLRIARKASYYTNRRRIEADSKRR